MKELIIYQCDHCGKTYEKELDCRRCESLHVHTKTIKGESFNPNLKDKNYPEWIEFNMCNGEVARYKLIR